MITLDKYAETTVGIFFVAKRYQQLRVVSDTRCVNVLFREPDHTASPTASSNSRLEAPSEDYLLLSSQGDLENAFYMLRGFPGLSDCFVMPPIKARAFDIRELNLTSSIGMGWSCIIANKFRFMLGFSPASENLPDFTTDEP